MAISGQSGSLVPLPPAGVPGEANHTQLREQFLTLMSGAGQMTAGDIHLQSIVSWLLPSALSHSTTRSFMNGCRGFPSPRAVHAPAITIAIILLCKRAETAGSSTPDLKLRVDAVYRLFHDGKIPDSATVHIVFTGHNREAEAAQREFENLLDNYKLPIDPQRVSFHLEPTARNTTENIERSCKLLIDKGITPDVIVVCSTDWHLFRMFLNYGMVPEKAEFPIVSQYFPHARIVLLMAPYPYRETTMENWKRWRAEVHVQTHFMAPLVTLLYAIADGVVTGVRKNVLDLAQDAFHCIETLMESPEANDPRNEGVCGAWDKDHRALAGALQEIERRLGNTQNSTATDLPGPRNIQYTWEQFAKYVNDIINSVRFPSDPDRT